MVGPSLLKKKKTIPPTATNKSKKKQKAGNDKKKATHQSTLFNSDGFKKKFKHGFYISADILLTDAIYGKSAPKVQKDNTSITLLLSLWKKNKYSL